MLSYKFGIDEVMTKINILKEEFSHRHDYSPIEHVSSRLKSSESLITKVKRKGFTPSLDAIRENIHDIAGLRVTCSFIADTYKVFDMIASQQDVTVVQVRDYNKEPKPNGYKSLHAIIEVPIFMSDRVQSVKVELQIRTIAMDFWASLEHKIYYKYNRVVPAILLQDSGMPRTWQANWISRWSTCMTGSSISTVSAAPATARLTPVRLPTLTCRMLFSRC
jgi:putative GTP pyrophosphokinase